MEGPARQEGLQLRADRGECLQPAGWKKEEGMRGGFLEKEAFQLGLQEKNINNTNRPNKQINRCMSPRHFCFLVPERVLGETRPPRPDSSSSITLHQTWRGSVGKSWLFRTSLSLLDLQKDWGTGQRWNIRNKH